MWGKGERHGAPEHLGVLTSGCLSAAAADFVGDIGLVSEKRGPLKAWLRDPTSQIMICLLSNHFSRCYLSLRLWENCESFETAGSENRVSPSAWPLPLGI